MPSYSRRLRDVLLSFCCLPHEEEVMGRERISYVIENPEMYTYWKSHKKALDLKNFENSKVRRTKRFNFKAQNYTQKDTFSNFADF